MKLIRSLLLPVFLLAAIAVATVHGWQSSGLAGALVSFMFVSALAAGLRGACLLPGGLVRTATLTVTEILDDIIESFANEFPGLNLMGTDFTPKTLKLNKTYEAHITALPTASTYDATTGYANGAVDARGLLSDIPITVDTQPTCPIKFLHLDAIKDDKRKYSEAIRLTGYVLAKAVVDALFADVRVRNFSQETVIAAADFDFDVLSTITGLCNNKKMLPNGRVLFVNSTVANTLAGDSRLSSKDYSGQQPGGFGIRRWTNVGGFALIQEYTDLPTNNATALTGVAAEADDDILTKTAHGLLTGDPVTITVMTGGTGLSLNTTYYVIKLSSSTFSLATTRALAMAGTAINVTLDGSSITMSKVENLIGFAFDARAFSILAGIPEGFESELMAQLGIPPTMGMKVITNETTKITMAGVGWQQQATNDLYFTPTFVYGKRVGANAGAAGAETDYAGLRIVSARA